MPILANPNVIESKENKIVLNIKTKTNKNKILSNTAKLKKSPGLPQLLQQIKTIKTDQKHIT